MSQEKVDRYKEEKKNRAKIMKKQKMEVAALKLGGTVIALLLVAWVGFSVYQDTKENTSETYQIKTEALDDYLATMNEDSTEAESEAAETEAAETEAVTEAATE